MEVWLQDTSISLFQLLKMIMNCHIFLLYWKGIVCRGAWTPHFYFIPYMCIPPILKIFWTRTIYSSGTPVMQSYLWINFSLAMYTNVQQTICFFNKTFVEYNCNTEKIILPIHVTIDSEVVLQWHCVVSCYKSGMSVDGNYMCYTISKMSKVLMTVKWDRKWY